MQSASARSSTTIRRSAPSPDREQYSKAPRRSSQFRSRIRQTERSPSPIRRRIEQRRVGTDRIRQTRLLRDLSGATMAQTERFILQEERTFVGAVDGTLNVPAFDLTISSS